MDYECINVSFHDKERSRRTERHVDRAWLHIAVFPFMETLTDVETHTLIPIHRNAADTQTV